MKNATKWMIAAAVGLTHDALGEYERQGEPLTPPRPGETDRNAKRKARKDRARELTRRREAEIAAGRLPIGL